MVGVFPLSVCLLVPLSFLCLAVCLFVLLCVLCLSSVSVRLFRVGIVLCIFSGIENITSTLVLSHAERTVEVIPSCCAIISCTRINKYAQYMSQFHLHHGLFAYISSLEHFHRNSHSSIRRFDLSSFLKVAFHSSQRELNYSPWSFYSAVWRTGVME